VLAVVIGGLNSIGAYAERRAKKPTEDACTTMLTYHQSAPGEDDASDAWDRLRYVESRLDQAPAPEAAAIRDYLIYDRLFRGAGRTPNDVVLGMDDIGLVNDGGTGHVLLMQAARACTELGHAELQEYLYDEDYASQ
jgi:hypothetical protein